MILATAIDPTSLPKPATDKTEVATILEIVRVIIGALALLFITIAGLRYVISNGDPQDTAKAKNGIVYALAGVALAIVAEIIVSWVIGRLS